MAEAIRTTNDDPEVGRTLVLGAVIGFVVTTIVVTVAGTLAGIGSASSLGLGAFIGAWGGAGFGFMMGGSVAFAHQFDRPPARAGSTRDHGQGEPHDPATR
jgi:hypothetical protein